MSLMKSYLKGSVSFQFLASLSLSTSLILPAIAQSDQSADTEIDDEVLVVGRYLDSSQSNSVKTPTPIIDVPQSLSIFTADQIIEQGFDSIGDLVLYTPGINQSQGEGHRDAIVFRGVRSTADFYIDGVRDDVQYYRSLYNLNQIEILRGPNALLFGRGGTGGVLNRVTKKGVIGENFTGFKSSVDTFGAFDIQLDKNFAVNDKAAFRVNGYYESLNNHRDFFDGDRFGINPTLRVEVTPDTVFDLSYEYVDNERFVDRGIPAGSDGRPAEELADITFSDSELATTTLVAHTVRAKLSHTFNDYFKVNLSGSYGDFDKLYLNFFPVSFNEETNVVGIDGYVDTTQRQNLILSADLIGEFEALSFGHTILFGGEFIDTNNDNDRFNTFFDQTQDDVEFFDASQPINLLNGVGINSSGEITTNSFAVDLNDDTEADVTVFSVYFQDQIAIAPWLDIVLGGRFDSFDIEVDDIEVFLETGQRDITQRTDQEFSPRLGVIFKPQENISIYGSFSETFLPRSGEQFADLPDDPATPDDETLDPNTFQNLEVGLKWDFDNGLSLSLAAFENEQSSPQESDVEIGTLVIIDSEVRGIEAQLQGQLTDKFDFSLGYSYLEGNQVDQIDGQSVDNGLRLRELPSHTVNVWGNYQILPRFGLGAGLTYQDESFAGNDNSVTLPSFVRIDAAAYYDLTDDVRLQVNLENLTDTEYFPNAHTNNNITVGAPINAKFTISGRF